jgi:hypothetical protein
MSETFFLCRCQRDRVPHMTIEELRAYQFIVEREGDTTTSTCPACGTVNLVEIDGGTLDLGLVTDEQLKSHNDFTVFDA